MRVPPEAPAGRPPELDRLAVFSILWAIASLFHHWSFGVWFSSHPWLNWTLVATAILLLFRPRSLTLLALLAGLDFLNVVDMAPHHPNHMLLELLVDAGILLAVGLAVLTCVRRRGGERSGLPFGLGPWDRDRVFRDFAAVARVALLLLYFYAVLHKLNWDFLDPEVSCGANMFAELLLRLGLPEPTHWMRVQAIWATLALETAIPLLLLFARTRLVGVGVALLFHYLLPQHGHPGVYSFSAMLYALLFLFMPPAFTEDLARRSSALRRRLRARPAVAVLLVVATLGIAVATAPHPLWHDFQLGIWSLWAIVCIYLYLRYALGRLGEHATLPHAFRPASVALWIVPALVLVNGMSPYLGLKTESSFSMFSNLRTEGGRPNHLFMRQWVRLGSAQDDLVEILASDVPYFRAAAQEGQLMTWHIFRSWSSWQEGDFFADYVRNGARHRLEVRNGIGNDPEPLERIPYWQHKLLDYRPIDKGPAMHCHH